MKADTSKTLCGQMLDNVLKVPYHNRPNRGMIKQMIVQSKQVNNLFHQDVSFKKTQKLAEFRLNF